MIANCFLKILVNPRFGRRRCSGIWPPSNPRFWLKPVPACWPLCPRAEVLPCPDPMPRPTRLAAFFWPAGGLNPLRFINSPAPLFHDFQQMRDLLHHPAEHGRVGPLDNLIELAQTETLDHPLVLFGGADRAAHQLDFDLAFH